MLLLQRQAGKHPRSHAIRCACMQGLRISPRGPLPLPSGFPRRSISYAGSSGGTSPAWPGGAQSLFSLDTTAEAAKALPLVPPLAGGCCTASQLAAPAVSHAQLPHPPLKPTHARSASCLPGPAGVQGARDSSGRGGSSGPSSIAYLNGADTNPAHLGASKLLALEDPCDLRSWSAPSRPCPGVQCGQRGCRPCVGVGVGAV